MTSFAQVLEAKDFVVTVELDPPKGVDTTVQEERAAALSGRVDALVLSDNLGARARLAPVALAGRLREAVDCALIVTLTCRDRNRLGLTSEMLALAAAGVETLLVVSGDHPTLGDHPGAMPVYDLDSVQALQLAAELNQGRDLAGNALESAPRLLAGATCAPQASPLEPQLVKFRKKLGAGAHFFITLPLDEAAAVDRFREQAGGEAAEVPILAGVEVGAEMDASRIS